MAQYNYVDTTGKMQSVQADTLDAASKLATNKDAQSGFQLVNTPSSNSATTGAISANQMTPATQMQTPQVPPTDPNTYKTTTQSATDSIISTLKDLTTKRDAAQADQTKTANDIITRMQYIADNKTQDTQNANETAGVNAATIDFNKYIDQLTNLNASATSLNREAQAIPIQDQQNATGQGVTDAGLAPQTAGRLRENALKALSIAQQADIASAAATGSLTKLNMAKEKAQQIVDLKYKPLEDSLAIRQKQYDLNKDLLDSLDKKRSEALAVTLEKEKQDLADKKATEKEKSQIITDAAPYAPADLLAKANAAPDAKTAAMILGKYSKDYLNNILLNEQIKTQRANQAKTYAETAKIKAETTSASKEQIKTAEENKLKVQTLTTKIGDLSVLKNNNYLSTAVGPNQFARVSFLDAFTGGKQDFIAGVQKVTNQETLDSLLQLKKAGGTLGALNESEGQMLRDAATKINYWALHEDPKNPNKVTGYNASEEDFKNELETMRTLAQQAIVNAGGSPDIINPISKEAADHIDNIIIPSINTANAQSTNVISNYGAQFTRN